MTCVKKELCCTSLKSVKLQSFDVLFSFFFSVLKAIDVDSKEVPDLLTNYILKGIVHLSRVTYIVYTPKL